MESLPLPLSLKREMLDHATGCPDEVGGFVVGRRRDLPHRLIRIGNTHPEPAAHIDFDESDVIAAYADMDAEFSDPVAVYHSHPVGPAAVPSTRDVALAPDLDMVYLIVAPQASPSVRAWRISEIGGIRQADEIPIRWHNDDDDLETLRGYLAEGSVVSLAYRSSTGEDISFGRTRVFRLETDSVVVLVERRQVRIALDRINEVELIESAEIASTQRTYAGRLLTEAAEEMAANRIGAARTAIEAACRAVPGLRPRMDPEVR